MTSAIVLVVPEAEPVVGALRLAHDPVARIGVPAHVTLLFPFMPADPIDAGVVARLAAQLAGQAALELRFDRVGRFPEVLYLAPARPEALVERIRALAAAWPAYPPYGGAFADIVPHLTVAHGDAAVLAEAEAEVAPQLPIVARVTAASLLVEADGRWCERARLPFG